MTGDIWTILWRDLRSYAAQFEEPRRFLLGVAASAIFLILIEFSFGIHEQIQAAHPVLLIWVWCWLPLGSAVTLSTDAIAGERERHTLESLLATRIPVRAILAGKTLSITIQSWISAVALAFGALAVLNLATIVRGEIVMYPWSVLLFGPLFSFFLTMLGTLVAIFFSMDSPTVRQANFRIIMVTSILPVLMIVPFIVLLFIAVIASAFAMQFTNLRIDIEGFSVTSTMIVTAVIVFLIVLLVGNAIAYLVTAMRFTRERLLEVGTGAGAVRDDSVERGLARRPAQTFGLDRSASPRPPQAAVVGASHGWMSILQDAGAVAWKELTEAKGMVREWRGWLLIVGVVLLSMVIQLAAFGSWYWSEDADTSLLFWLGMAAALPLLIAQRSADAIAGERERHTGEILFTTRLSHAGILIGKFGVTALLPWLLLLVVPASGLIATNLIYGRSGPHLYPPDVLVAGVGLSLGVAFLFASAGMLVSLNAPTVQHAARRISWFLLPVLIAPGMILRNAAWTTSGDGVPNLDESGLIAFAASGRLTLYALAALPVIALVSATLIYFLFIRFQRGNTVFD